MIGNIFLGFWSRPDRTFGCTGSDTCSCLRQTYQRDIGPGSTLEGDEQDDCRHTYKPTKRRWKVSGIAESKFTAGKQIEWPQSGINCKALLSNLMLLRSFTAALPLSVKFWSLNIGYLSMARGSPFNWWCRDRISGTPSCHKSIGKAGPQQEMLSIGGRSSSRAYSQRSSAGREKQPRANWHGVRQTAVNAYHRSPVLP